MAISDVKEYTHLTEEQVEELGRELDALREEIEESRGAADAAYINRMITIQRRLAAAGRITLFASKYKPAFFAGTAMLGIAKILGEHGDRPQRHARPVGLDERPGDPLLQLGVGHRAAGRAVEALHHDVHHQFTNVLGHDNDIGYGVLGRRASSAGTRSTSASRSTTHCSRRCSNGASRCTTSTSRRSARAARTPRR